MNKGQMWFTGHLWLCGSWHRAINMETGQVCGVQSAAGDMFQADAMGIRGAFWGLEIPVCPEPKSIDSLPPGCIFNSEGDNFLKVAPFTEDSGIVYSFCTFDGTFLPSGDDLITNRYARWKLHVVEQLQPEIRLASEGETDEERRWEPVPQSARRTRRPPRPS